MKKLGRILGSLLLAACVLEAATSCGVTAGITGFNSGDRYVKTEVRYVLSNGECVWNVLEEYFDKQDRIRNLNEFVYTVRAANGLTQSRKVLHPGDVLIIPLEKKVNK